MMRLYDQHLHSRHSMDSETEPEDNVRRALAVSLAGLTFTEHFDTHPEEWPACRYDDDSYSKTIAGLRAKYSELIFIGKGIEVCYQPERMDFILDFLDRHTFDLVLLSVHWAGGKAFHRREHWKELSVPEAAKIYFAGVLEAARLSRDLYRQRGRRVFDVLGHLDLIKRYSHRFFGNARPNDGHEELIDEILRTCLDAELVPEINTSAIRQGVGEPMPGLDIIRRYAKLGGRTVSLGSDAHSADSIGADFTGVTRALPGLGIEELAVFEQRKLIVRPFH